MSETGPAQQLFNVGNLTGAAAFCIGIRAGALDTAYFFLKNYKNCSVVGDFAPDSLRYLLYA